MYVVVGLVIIVYLLVIVKLIFSQIESCAALKRAFLFCFGIVVAAFCIPIGFTHII